MAKKPWKHHLDEIQRSLDYLSTHKGENNKTYQKNWLKLSKAASLIPKEIRNQYKDIPWTQVIKFKTLIEKGGSEELSTLYADLVNQVDAIKVSFGPFFQKANEPVHPWKICPPGEVYIHEATVSEHMRANRVIKEHLRRDHCRNVGNFGFKNVLTPQETTDMADLFFSNLTTPLGIDDFEHHEKGNKYDSLIRGWTAYWNDVFKPAEPLDVNLVKALIKSESSFIPTEGKKNKEAGKGLMQLLPDTIKILNNPEGELRDHLFEFDPSEVFDPSLNIAAGIRWLFHKKYLAENRLKRKLTWIEAVEEYKDILRRRLRGIKYDESIMPKLLTYLEKLKERK